MFGCHSCGQKLKHLMRLGCSQDTKQFSWQFQAPATKMKVAKKAGNMGQHGSNKVLRGCRHFSPFQVHVLQNSFLVFFWHYWTPLYWRVCISRGWTKPQTCQTLQQTQALKCFNILILKMTLSRLLLSHREALSKGVPWSITLQIPS